MHLISDRFAARLAICALFASLCSCAPTPAPAPARPMVAAPAEPPSAPVRPTKILDREGAQRLLGAKGITLQWIDWNRRGSVNVRQEGGMIRLTGTQTEPARTGALFMDGRVEEIGADYFTFRGVIRISDTPDRGRDCSADKLWHFAITQNRPYWRLREFEWCDDLTDYIDIYF